MGVTLTEKAASEVKRIIEEQGNGQELVLRIGVQGGGCSGMTYFMDFDEARADDKVFASGGVRVVVDPKSILHLSGAVLDFSEGLMGSGFTIKNPNAKSSCGCGSSFNT